MQTIYVEVGPEGALLHFVARKRSGVILTLPDSVFVGSMPLPPSSLPERPDGLELAKGFPPRDLTEAAIVQVLHEHGGEIKIREEDLNIYDELAARLGVSIEARQRPTQGTGEPAWRPEVGFARKNLEQKGIMSPTSVSGRGVWALAPNRG